MRRAVFDPHVLKNLICVSTWQTSGSRSGQWKLYIKFRKRNKLASSANAVLWDREGEPIFQSKFGKVCILQVYILYYIALFFSFILSYKYYIRRSSLKLLKELVHTVPS